jgi:AraC-like DNA-binding protein
MMNMSDTSRPLETVAAQFGYSKYHISRIFKKTYGQSIHEYIDELKIARAINLLLNTDRSVNQIAEELGYPSADSFIKFFKYHRSCSPGAFRRNLKQNGSEKG